MATCPNCCLSNVEKLPRGKKVGVIAGGAWGGAEVGAALGSVVPEIGTLIGGTLGAIAGGIADGVAGGKYLDDNEFRQQKMFGLRL